MGGTCQAPTSGACDSDTDCASGSLCVAGSSGAGGLCQPESNQCFDQAQCGAGERCVAGKCVPECFSNADCRDGFTCDTARSECLGVAQPCSITNDCGGPTLVCVGGACVPRSTGGACANPGDVWTENGCIPNQAPNFVCQNDGVQDTCATGSLCLHHDCWIACDPSTGAPCNTQTILNTCKPVVSEGSTYNVCGTSTNLGSQCGAGSPGDLTCSSANLCIDGYCK